MRIAIPLGFLATIATAGCNQIFGLEKTQPWDAPLIVDGTRTVSISERSVGTDSDGKATAPVNSAPTDLEAFQHGALGVAAVSMPVPFEGGESVSFVDQGAWRLVLLRTGQVPHELQFPADITAAHVTLPRWSRLDRAPLPSGDNVSVSVTPTGYSNPMPGSATHRIFTTGIWTSSTVGVSTGGMFQVFFRCAMGCTPARSLDGSLAAPETAKGDRYVAIKLDYFNGRADCLHAVGDAGFQADLVTGDAMGGTPPWRNMPRHDTTLGFQPLVDRFVELDGTDPESDLRYRVGIAPSDALPAFTHAGEYLLGGPPMLELISCASGAGEPTMVIPESLEQRFPLLGHLEVARTQTLGGGVKLVNGVTATLRLPYDLMIEGTLESVAPFATELKLDDTAVPTRGEGVMVPEPAMLTFTDQLAAADYWNVSLYEISGSMKTLRRVYTVPAPVQGQPVQVDLRATTLAKGPRYVFEIRGFTGQPNARQGDFQEVGEQQSMTQIHSATFVVQ